jgi:hypothetical protein
MAQASFKSLFTILVALACLLSISCAQRDPVLRGLERDSVIAATLEWARLAPFPQSAEKLVVTTEGSMFTRTFRVHFRAPAKEIEQWVQESPGLRESTPTAESGGLKYVIKPGGGANRAEVIISNGEQVSIYASWS